MGTAIRKRDSRGIVGLVQMRHVVENLIILLYEEQPGRTSAPQPIGKKVGTRPCRDVLLVIMAFA